MADNAISIEAMIDELGPPRNYAEQMLIDRMRHYAVTEMALPSVDLRHVEWVKALITKHCILTFRAHGDTSVMMRYP